MHLISLRSLLAVLSAAVTLLATDALACGCFAGPTTATTPVIQAGERILFAVQNGKVTAHIQIQYQGDAKDFGWLLPLPSVPVLKAGTDELFTQLSATTDPRFTVNFQTVGTCRARGIALGCEQQRLSSPSTIDRVAEGTSLPPPSPLVFQTSVGPYDAAVLKADDKAEMLGWLSNNRFVVPTTSDAALGPYLRPGAYFLALKLKSGKSAGDLTPIVVEYPSELPMIPITLTSIGATPDMGVQVFLLGNGRAIPRNYRHAVINETLLDWETGGQNYQSLVTRAVGEAPGRHAFVTDYAGPSSVMRDVLVPAGRFGNEAQLAAATSPEAFVELLWTLGFGQLPPVADPTNTGFAPAPAPPRFAPGLQAVLLRMLPIPKSLADANFDADAWFRDFARLDQNARQRNPEDFVDYPAFDAQQLARAVFAEYVAPVREANELFRTFPTLTRLFTTLSPADMTRDPVFSFNPSLPEVPRVRSATWLSNCDNNTVRLVTPSGLSRPPDFGGGQPPTLAPGVGALRIETLAEEGDPLVDVDNKEAVLAQFPEPPGAPAGGCTSVPDPLTLTLFALAASLRRRRME
ncbi:MAG: DUF2330 domain-containing protein [Myxococcaceae bacterium]|nr:DUF2330 domain-containing protein [Myxococcaceae bacterium]